LILLFALAYLAGSVNFSILVFWITGREDPRNSGSGNPGATNVYRHAGLRWAAAVLLLDMGRAFAVALMACAWLPIRQVPWVGFGLILGNRFPCFHGFRGGKGVANYLGFTLALAPVWAVFSALAWAGVQLIWRTPFLSSFAMVFFLVAATVHTVDGSGWGTTGSLVTALFIVACHHRNMRERWGEKGAPPADRC